MNLYTHIFIPTSIMSQQTLEEELGCKFVDTNILTDAQVIQKLTNMALDKPQLSLSPKEVIDSKVYEIGFKSLVDEEEDDKIPALCRFVHNKPNYVILSYTGDDNVNVTVTKDWCIECENIPGILCKKCVSHIRSIELN